MISYDLEAMKFALDGRYIKENDELLINGHVYTVEYHDYTDVYVLNSKTAPTITLEPGIKATWR